LGFIAHFSKCNNRGRDEELIHNSFLWLAKFADDLSLLLAKNLQSNKSKVLPTK
jgi:hypothetical protein